MINNKIKYFCTYAFIASLFAAGLTSCKNGQGITDDNSAGLQMSEQTQGSDENNQSETVPGNEAADSYMWDVVTVTFPESWAGRYEIVEADYGFDIYQKAVYDKYDADMGMGFLCEICRDDFWRNDGAGETLLAYTDDGEMYYFREPTDFPLDTENEDESIIEEYQAMMDDIDVVMEQITFDGDGVHADARDYQIPVSDFVPITSDMLLNETANWLWLAKNEIYARHGKIFTNDYLNSYFNSRSWYTPVSADIGDDALSDIERENVIVLAQALDEYDSENPYPTRYEKGETAIADIDGDGTAENIRYELVQTGDWEYAASIIINGKSYDLSEYYYPETPLDVFYLTDIAQYDGKLEIAILDEGPSYDPYTMFFRYEGGELSYIGPVDGFPFQEENGGRYGFDGGNLVMGTARADLIETSYLDCFWWYDSTSGTISMQEGAMCSYQTFKPHELYVDLPVYITMDEDAPTRILKAQDEVFFLASDLTEWILVEGKDGTRGYVHVSDYTITNIGLPEEDVFSSVGYFD